MSSFIVSAISKSAGGLCDGDGAVGGGGGFDIDFRTASDCDLDFEGDTFAFMLEGDRGISGDTAFDDGAISRSIHQT